jgi:hypothetical protein
MGTLRLAVLARLCDIRYVFASLRFRILGAT